MIPHPPQRVEVIGSDSRGTHRFDPGRVDAVIAKPDQRLEIERAEAEVAEGGDVVGVDAVVADIGIPTPFAILFPGQSRLGRPSYARKRATSLEN